MGIIDWIYPKKCGGCGAWGQYICPTCTRQIDRREGSLRYRGVVRKALKSIKYRGSYDMIGELVEIWSPRNPEMNGRLVVTSVPMWEQKKRMRGFDQAELIARALARKWGRDYQTLLVRKRETRAMYGLTRTERMRNVQGAFKMINQYTNKPVNQYVVLVDDVWTTGATMGECMRVLIEAGMRKVIPMALAR